MPHPGVVASQAKADLYPWLPDGAMAWYDASDLASVVVNGDQVEQWISGIDGVVLTPAGAGVGDAIRVGLATQNGLQTITFDHDPVGNTYATLYNTSHPVIDVMNCIISGVARTRNGSFGEGWVSFGSYFTGFTLTHVSTEAEAGWGVDVEDVESWIAGPALYDQFHLQTLTVLSGVATLRLDGVEIATKAVAPIAATNNVAVGGNSDSPNVGGKTPCDVCEIVASSGAWTAQEVTDLETYLMTKWALPAAPPDPPPAWMPANAVAWFDASDAASVVTDGSGAVLEWKDKLAGTYTVTADGNDAVRHGDVLQNGLSTVSFDGTARVTYNVTGPPVDATNCMLIGVARTAGGDQRTWLNVGGGSVSGWALTHVGEPSFGNHGYGVLLPGLEWWIPGAAVVDTFNLQTLTVGAGTATIRKDLVDVATAAKTTNPAERLFMVGCDEVQGTMCEVCEFVIVSGAWTVAERDAVEAALRAKWGTP